METNNEQIQLSVFFRILTGALLAFGVYGLYSVISKQYISMVNCGVNLERLIIGVILIMSFSAWVYLTGYLTLTGTLPIKSEQQQSDSE
ncbi:hypothetical protein [Pseudoalteromonas sp. T1lg48]|uniref:hypothetical protein n=1 Tax=Pseudoalteromonas sp. T1lg48 TaxID=2077100 RepID=UPI000CF701B0|nr:hypothetical protein [Pseudoalteromonas sp. T1lg48]